MKFDALSNEEIIFIHLIVEDLLEGINTVLDNGGVSYIVDTPLGKVEVFGKFTDDQLKEMNESTKVELARSIYEKFKPVYQLIGEENQEAINKVRDELFPKKTESLE